MMVGVILDKSILFILVMTLFGFNSYAANPVKKYTCGYISDDKKNQTIIQFELPKIIRFGQKVVLDI